MFGCATVIIFCVNAGVDCLIQNKKQKTKQNKTKQQNKTLLLLLFLLLQVRCGGRNACSTSEITVADIVFGIGRASLEATVISNISESVYCNGYRSCLSSTINYISGNIYANGFEALHSSKIHVVKNSVYAYGYQALAYSTVTNVSDAIHCVGELSCSQATLSGMKSIVASKDNALEGAVIYGPVKGDLLVISINNDNTGDSIYIHCNLTDYCVLYCQSAKACSKVIFYCQYDSCTSTCNENVGIECPNIIEVAPYTTPAPTVCQNVLIDRDVQTGVSVTVVILLAIGNGVIAAIWMTDRKRHKARIQNITKGVEIRADLDLEEEDQSTIN